MTAPEHDRAGWQNWCRSCGRRYWVSNRDINADKMRRWEDDTLTVRHTCEDLR